MLIVVSQITVLAAGIIIGYCIAQIGREIRK
jgi:hypothetical protein